MMEQLEQVDEQTHITELSIAPDGRVYVFGMSRQILEVLEMISPTDDHLQQLMREVFVTRPSCPCRPRERRPGAGETPVLQKIGDAQQ